MEHVAKILAHGGSIWIAVFGWPSAHGTLLIIGLGLGWLAWSLKRAKT